MNFLVCSGTENFPHNRYFVLQYDSGQIITTIPNTDNLDWFFSEQEAKEFIRDFLI